MPRTRHRGREAQPATQLHAQRYRPRHRRVSGTRPPTSSELITVELLATAAASHPREPSCEGPLVIHADGEFECHGPDCPGGTRISHSTKVFEPCRPGRGDALTHTCLRCAPVTTERRPPSESGSAHPCVIDRRH